MMRLVIKRSNQAAKEIYVNLIDNDISPLQELIGGYIQEVIIGNLVYILCDEDGLAKNSPDNCGFFGNLIFAEQKVTKTGWAWTSLSSENVRKVFAWCELHEKDVHKDKLGKTLIAISPKDIKAYKAKVDLEIRKKVLEWEVL